MEIFGLFIPVLALVLVGLIVAGFVGWSLFILLVQLGVIVHKAQDPPHIDAGIYDLKQGRDVGADDRR